MRVQLKKIANGKPSLACVRADGSRTWSRLHAFFPLHDLTHLAVESVLGFREAFFGLVAAGWEIDDFAEPGAVSRLPAEALVAECIVGLLDLERANGQILDQDAFNVALSASLAGQGRPPFRPVQEAELASIRTLRGDMMRRWTTLGEGQTLDLGFPAVLVRS